MLDKKVIYIEIIQQLIDKDNYSPDFLHLLKRNFCKKCKCDLIENNKLLKIYKEHIDLNNLKENKKIINLLTIKKVRTLSGVAIITVLTMPYPCPGRCIYCPEEARMPKSYLASEPAAARAKALEFDPYNQVAKRIEMLEKNGHESDKIELIIKGGTWSFYPKAYREWFILRCFQAMNQNPYNQNKDFEDDKNYLLDIIKVQSINEISKYRCIGLTIETRPDYVTIEEIIHLRKLGCTRIELGVQTIDDNILHLVKRGHTKQQVIDATKLLRDAGFKVDYHIMPGLPGSNPEKDFKICEQIFDSSSFKPDNIKLYPCVVMPNTELAKWHEKGLYKTYSKNQLIELLSKIKSIVPPYIRIARVIRDIPSDEISAGNKTTNLREMVQAYMKKRNLKCRCLRCREVGHCQIVESSINYNYFKYEANDGIEYFLSYESMDNSILYAFTRLRLPKKQDKNLISLLPEIKKAALIRELHTYGHLVPIKKSLEKASQHKGLGKKLIEKAEEIARSHGYQKMAVISGIGVRKYYESIGYKLENDYMVKEI